MLTHKKWYFYLIPHHFISRIVLVLTRVPQPFCRPFIAWFIRAFNVDLSTASNQDIKRFTNFNAFFTRALRHDARPIDTTPNALVSPVDGRFSQLGNIDKGRIFQAKQSFYNCELLLGQHVNSEKYLHGSFANIYLSPRDYHRIHMPIDGELLSVSYIPGRLFSVAPAFVENIPRLFARNERVVCEFKTATGYLAMAFVGAINVAAIDTVWQGRITPNRQRSNSLISKTLVSVKKGDEIARFNMGSTVILLSDTSLTFADKHQTQSAIQMGELLATF